jgi:hypothetical protein
MENNEIIGYAVITPDGDLLNFETEAEAAEHGSPVPVVHLEEIVQ